MIGSDGTMQWKTRAFNKEPKPPPSLLGFGLGALDHGPTKRYTRGSLPSPLWPGHPLIASQRCLKTLCAEEVVLSKPLSAM